VNTQSRELDALTHSLVTLRHAVLRDGFLDAIRSMDDHELSVAQMATLMLLESEGGSTVGDHAHDLGRSLSATSRSLDQLVTRGLVCRQEAAHDRRVKLVTLDEGGRELIGRVQRRRAEAQLAVMAALSPDDRQLVMQAMALLADAATRRRADVQPPTP
jgi:DNA-binding MarR family transcriptional regulator